MSVILDRTPGAAILGAEDARCIPAPIFDQALVAAAGTGLPTWAGAGVPTTGFTAPFETM